MFRFFQFTQDLIGRWPFTPLAAAGHKNGRILKRLAQRRRRTAPMTMEAIEPRVLLSSTHQSLLAASAVDKPAHEPTAHISIHDLHRGDRIDQAKKLVSTHLTGLSGTGVRGGTATLTATLTSGGAPLSGRIVRFQVRGRNVGKATTDAHGIATRVGAKIGKTQAGIYRRGVRAIFAGDSTHNRVNVRGTLTVSRFATSLNGVVATGVYGGGGTFTASLTSHGAPVVGRAIAFRLNGHVVGHATTNAQGVATLDGVRLAGINAGLYPGAVTATFAGGSTYQNNSSTGALAVGRAQAAINLRGLLQTYNGHAKSVTAKSSPPGVAVAITYTDSDGQVVTNPVDAGSYGVAVSVTGANYGGTANATLVIAPAAIRVSGITASDKPYDGTTDATIDTSGAALVGVVAGDDVALGTTDAIGTFDSSDVGTDKTVYITGLTLTGADAGDYILDDPTTTASIT